MASKGYFEHTSPQGLTPWYWFENVGYNFSYAGENLAVNFSDSRDVTNAWMNSPEHRANILSGDFTQIGIATAQGVYNGQQVVFVVEEFGTPAAAPVAFVNTASVQSVATTEPIPPVVTVVKSTPKNPVVPVVVTVASGATTTVPIAMRPVIKPGVATLKPVAVVPTVVAMNSAPVNTNNSNQTFVAVKGADAQSVHAVLASATTTPVATSVIQSAQPALTPIVTANSVTPVPQENIVQKSFSNPKMLANDFYLLLMAIFAGAIVLNVFIKIRVQYPRLIAGGLLVVVVAGLCIMLNQDIGLLHATIL
jgi:hypothetical protein